MGHGDGRGDRPGGGAGVDVAAAATRSLLIMPMSGREAVLSLIEDARSSVQLKIYSLTDDAVIEALVAAQRRGVAVRAILNAARADGSHDNEVSEARLLAAGAAVRPGSTRFAATHEKSLTIDGRMSLISSFNYGEKYFSETRDFGIVTRDPAEVAEIVACFDADWQDQPFHPENGSRLLWAPGTSRRQVAALLASAKKTVHLQHAKLVDSTVLLQLTQAVARGVTVRFLCPGAHGLHHWDRPETFAALGILRHVGGKVRRLKTPKMHGNLTLVDGRAAQLGSLHFHHVSSDTRRELSIEVEDEAIVGRLAERFEADWKEAERYAPPDPIQHGDTDPVDGEVFRS